MDQLTPCTDRVGLADIAPNNRLFGYFASFPACRIIEARVLVIDDNKIQNLIKIRKAIDRDFTCSFIVYMQIIRKDAT